MFTALRAPRFGQTAENVFACPRAVQNGVNPFYSGVDLGIAFLLAAMPVSAPVLMLLGGVAGRAIKQRWRSTD